MLGRPNSRGPAEGRLARPRSCAPRPVREPAIAGNRVRACGSRHAVPGDLLKGVDLVVHAAAETAGDKPDHERNTILATRNLLDAMQRVGVRKLINISSVAVLVPSHLAGPLTENSPVDADNLSRGPYVWAKATAELEAVRRAAAGDVDLRTIRLGPLVDYDAYTPPGRLGREVARLFVGMGGRNGALSVCSVGTAAAVIRSYAENFGAAPAYVNLLEVPSPTRGELAERLKSTRPDLKFIWLPFPILRLLGGSLKLALKLLRPGGQALDLYAAFKSESYDPTIAAKVIASAAPGGQRSSVVTSRSRSKPDSRPDQCAASQGCSSGTPTVRLRRCSACATFSCIAARTTPGASSTGRWVSGTGD